MQIGGMPAVIKEFVANNDYRLVAQLQSDLVLAYQDDFNKYAKKADWELLNKTLSQKTV